MRWDRSRAKESGVRKSKGVSSEMQMELGEEGGLGCQVVAPDVPSPKGTWSLAAGFGMRGSRPCLPRGGSSHKSRRPGRGKGYSWFRCGLLGTPSSLQFAYIFSTPGLRIALPEVGVGAGA